MEPEPLALIIDDEQDICYLLGKMLSNRSIRTETAFSLKEGLLKLQQNKPFLLFLDIHLPDGSGLEQLKSIRSSYPNIFIVIMSAYDSADEKNTATDNGADFFLAKPFQREIIDELVNTSFLKS